MGTGWAPLGLGPGAGYRVCWWRPIGNWSTASNMTIPVNVASHRNVTANVKPCPLSGHLAQRFAERYDYLR